MADLFEFQDEVRRKNIAIEKAFDPFYIDPDTRLDIEKGRRLEPGTIRTHGGRKMQKQGDGSWKPVKEGGWKERKTVPRGEGGSGSGGDGGDLISGLKSMGFKKDTGSHGILSVGENEYSLEKDDAYQVVYNPKSKEITFADVDGNIEEGKARDIEGIKKFIKKHTAERKELSGSEMNTIVIKKLRDPDLRSILNQGAEEARKFAWDGNKEKVDEMASKKTNELIGKMSIPKNAPPDLFKKQLFYEIKNHFSYPPGTKR